MVAQLLTEVLALAVLGALPGLGVAAAAVHGFHMLGKTLPRAEEIALDWRVVVYSLVCRGGNYFVLRFSPGAARDAAWAGAFNGPRGDERRPPREAGCNGFW